MNFESIAGIVIITGSLLMVLASIMQPRGLYEEPDNSKQLAIIADNMRSYVISNIGFGLAGIVTAAGFVLLGLLLSASQSNRLNTLAAGSILIGAAFFAIFAVLRAFNPEVYFAEEASIWPAWIFFGLTELGLLLYGILLLLSAFPNWLGVTTITLVIVFGLVAARFPDSFPPQVIYLLTLLIGVVALVQ